MKTKRIHTIEDIDLEEMWVDLRDIEPHSYFNPNIGRVVYDVIEDISQYIHSNYRVADDYRKAKKVSKELALEVGRLFLQMGYLVRDDDNHKLIWQV